MWSDAAARRIHWMGDDLGAGFFDLGRDQAITEEYRRGTLTGQCLTCTVGDYVVVQVAGQAPHLTVRCPRQSLRATRREPLLELRPGAGDRGALAVIIRGMNPRHLVPYVLTILLLAGCDSRREEIEARLSAIQGAVETLEQKRADLESEVEALKAEVEEMKTEIEEANNAADEAKTEVETLKVEGQTCPRRSQFDPPCRSQLDPGTGAGVMVAGCL